MLPDVVSSVEMKHQLFSLDRITIALLAVIVVAGFAIRGLLLGSAPKGALIDEAHFGYLAYSLLQTGQDEHGETLPIIFKGFGDEKLPAYAYSLLPVVALGGLSTLTIRIPSLLAGTAFIVAMFLLARELGLGKRGALMAAVLTAFNPWPFFLSRIGFESNLALAFFGFGLWALWRTEKLLLEKHVSFERWAIAAGVLMGATWYSYIAYRPVAVVVLLGWSGLLWWRSKVSWRQLVWVLGTFVAVVAPLVIIPSAVGSNTARFKQVGIFSDNSMTMEIDEKRRYCGLASYWPICYVVWNKPTALSYTLARRFAHTYSPQYLFTEGEAGLNFLTVERTGQFHFLLYPFLILGILSFVMKFEGFELKQNAKWLVVLGLLLTPVPALLTGDAQKVRISPLLPFLLLVLTLGIEVALLQVPKKLQNLAAWVVAGSVAVAMAFYLVAFLTVHVYKYDYTYQSYLPDLYTYLAQYDGTNTAIYIKPFYSDPIMFYAYYRHVDPRHYQTAAILGPKEESGFQHTIGLDNYHVLDDDAVDILCKNKDSGQQLIMVTNETQPMDTTHIVYALAGGASQVYIYNLSENLLQHPQLCDGWKPS
jgi:4-amino-4-deoxy-L-arabinose transferase-like glycosyltransferase